MNETSSTTLLNQTEQLTIDWRIHNLESSTQKLCFHAEWNLFFEYICITYKTSINPYPREKTISRNACKRKILTTKLKRNINVELHLEEKDETSKQHYVTVFADVLEKSFEIQNKVVGDIKDMILDSDNIDFL